MTYLTRHDKYATFHFRVTIEDNGIDIVEGQYYKSIRQYFIGLKPEEKEAKAKMLIDEKLANGYVLTDFIETKENTLQVYDKAKYHSGGNFPEDLDHFQANVHTGMYVGWLMDNNLLDQEFFIDSQPAIQEFKNRLITGSQFYETQMDGVLLIDEVSEIGNRFSLEYFEFDNGKYLGDYEATLASKLPTLYHVQDTWENYEKIRTVIDKRFFDWNKHPEKKPWWKVW
jgi:hypothetical protein